MIKVHLPRTWTDLDHLACGGMVTLNDETITRPSQAEEVTCPECAAEVIEATLSDVRKVGC